MNDTPDQRYQRTADDVFAALGLPVGTDGDWSGYDLDTDMTAEEQADENRARAAEYFLANTPDRFRHAIASHPKVTDWVTRYLLDPAVAGDLVLMGGTGSGKSHQAYGALAAIGNSGRPLVRWVAESMPDLQARMLPSSGVNLETEFNRVANAPLLLLDELGANKGSDWADAITFRLVDRRYNRCLPTIYTTNIPLNELKLALGDRVNSRLAQTATKVKLNDGDRRRAA